MVHQFFELLVDVDGVEKTIQKIEPLCREVLEHTGTLWWDLGTIHGTFLGELKSRTSPALF